MPPADASKPLQQLGKAPLCKATPTAGHSMSTPPSRRSFWAFLRSLLWGWPLLFYTAPLYTRNQKQERLRSHPLFEPESPAAPTSPQQPDSTAFSSAASARPAAAGTGAIPATPPPTTSAGRARLFLLSSPLAAFVLRVSDDAWGLLSSMPRTARTLTWALRAGVLYKRYTMRRDWMAPDEYEKGWSELHNVCAQRLLEVCRANGGVYVKAGQFAAAFASTPNEYRIHLALLQDRAKPRPFAKVNRVIIQELGASAEQVFAEFHPEATAAASLAQVHKARLMDGQDVAIKIQYPGLRSAAKADLSVLNLLTNCATFAFPEWRLTWLFEELRSKLEEELDFHVEVHNALHLLQNLCRANDVTVPHMYTQYCTSRILTMEWVAGHKVNDVHALRKARVSPRAVGVQLEKAFAEMMFIHGYIHADPHPGNIMVRTTGRGGLWQWLRRGSWQPFEIVMLDHGSYLTLSEQMRAQYCQLWCALFAGDRAAAAEVAFQMGGARAGQILPVVLTQRARNKTEREQMQRAAGVSSMTDISQLVASAPRDVVEVLRITAVVRSVTSCLSCNSADRLRINGTYALKGLPQGAMCGRAAADGERHSAALFRLKILVRLGLLRGYVWTMDMLSRGLYATLTIFGQDVALS